MFGLMRKSLSSFKERFPLYSILVYFYHHALVTRLDGKIKSVTSLMKPSTHLEVSVSAHHETVILLDGPYLWIRCKDLITHVFVIGRICLLW